MLTRFLRPISILILLCLSLLPLPVYAAAGTPGEPAFGYGVRINLQDPLAEQWVQLAGKHHVDWIAIIFPWQVYQPDPNLAVDWSDLDHLLNIANENEIAVLISVTGAPHWVLRVDGPDAVSTQNLCIQIIERYQGTVKALELFPAANTRQGWGTHPNPTAYTNLVCSISQKLAAQRNQVLLVGPGVGQAQAPDIRPEDFLHTAYQSGLQDCLPIISMQLLSLASEPLTAPGDASIHNLRFYETIRQVMLENQHEQGVLWISALQWQPQTTPEADQNLTWVRQAYLLMRAQLYLGAGFYQLDEIESQDVIETGVVEVLAQIIAMENNSASMYFELSDYHIRFPKSYQKVAIP